MISRRRFRAKLVLVTFSFVLAVSGNHSVASPNSQSDSATAFDEGRWDASDLAKTEILLPAVPTKAGTSYLTISGTRFQPTSSELTYSPSGGAVWATALPPGGFSFSVDFDLPVGATITEVVFFVIDDDVSNVGVSLRSYDPETGVFLTLESASSSGASPSVQAIVIPVDPPVQVDPATTSYRLRVVPVVTSTAHLLRGARIGYLDPHVFGDGFESGDTEAWSQTVP